MVHGLSQSESNSSQPHDQIQVLLQPLLELPGGGSLGGSDPEVLGLLPSDSDGLCESDGLESDGCESELLSDALSDCCRMHCLTVMTC